MHLSTKIVMLRRATPEWVAVCDGHYQDAMERAKENYGVFTTQGMTCDYCDAAEQGRMVEWHTGRPGESGETVDIGPRTWKEALPLLLRLWESGNAVGKRYAFGELQRLAEIADLYRLERKRKKKGA